MATKAATATKTEEKKKVEEFNVDDLAEYDEEAEGNADAPATSEPAGKQAETKK